MNTSSAPPMATTMSSGSPINHDNTKKSAADASDATIILGIITPSLNMFTAYQSPVIHSTKEYATPPPDIQPRGFLQGGQ